MDTQLKNIKYLKDLKVNIKVKLSALWATLMFFYIYAYILGFYSTGVIEEVVTGEIGGVSITEAFLVSMTLWMAVASVMVFLSLILKSKVNRWLNIILGVDSFIALGANFFVGEFSARYTLQAIIEGALMAGLFGRHGSDLKVISRRL